MTVPAILAVSASVDTSATQITINYPTIVSAGKKIYALIADFGAAVFTSSGGWATESSRNFGSSNQHRMLIISKISDGTETGNFTFPLVVNNRKVGFMFSTTATTTHMISASSGATTALGANSINHDQLTTTLVDALIIYMFSGTLAGGDIGVANMTPGGADLGTALTFIQEGSRATTNSIYLGACTEPKVAAGLTTLRTSTHAGAATTLAQMTFAITIAAQITSVNGGIPVVDGQQNVEIVHSGMGTVTSVTLVAGTFQKTVSFTNSSSTLALADFPDIATLVATEAGVPFSSTLFDEIIVRVSDGSTIIEAPLTIVKKETHLLINIVDAITTLGSVFYEFEGTVLDGTQVYHEEDEWETIVSENGGIETNAPAGTTLDFKIFDPDSGNWIVHSITILNPGGESAGGNALIQNLIDNFSNTTDLDFDNLIYH